MPVPTTVGSAGTFTPSSIPGLVLWLEASRLPVVADGTAQQTFTPAAGTQASGPTQATGSKQPLYKVNIVNGRPVLRFDGTDDFQQVLFTQAHPATLVVACIFRAAFVANASVLDGGANLAMRLVRTSSTAMDVLKSSGASAGSIATTPQSWHVYSIVFNTTTGSFQVDNGAVTSLTDPGAAALAGLTLGARGDGTAAFGQVDIYGLSLHAGALTAGQRAQLARYWGAKTAVTIT